MYHNKCYSSWKLLCIFTPSHHNGNSLPSWLLSLGSVLLKRFVRNGKIDPYEDQHKLLNINPTYTNIRYAGGKESICLQFGTLLWEVVKLWDPLPPIAEQDKSTLIVPMPEESTTCNGDFAEVQQFSKEQKTWSPILALYKSKTRPHGLYNLWLNRLLFCSWISFS